MKPLLSVAGAAALALVLIHPPAAAQGTPQQMALAKVDVNTVATGYRSSKLVGSTVVNDANETVGKLDDLIVTTNSKVPFAVLSVGGFLGVGTRLVAVPFDSLKIVNNRVMLPGATKDAVKNLPEFKYASR